MLRLAFLYDRPSMEMQNKSGFGIKNCSKEASLWWKCFGTYKKYQAIYTFKDKSVRDFFRKSTKGGRVAALNRYFEPNRCEEILNTTKNTLRK